MLEVITVHCPTCETAFPVDPEKVPEGGVHARCSECSGVFRVDGSDHGSASGDAFDPGLGFDPGDAAASDGAVESEGGLGPEIGFESDGGFETGGGLEDEDGIADDGGFETDGGFATGGGFEDGGGDPLEADGAIDSDAGFDLDAGVDSDVGAGSGLDDLPSIDEADEGAAGTEGGFEPSEYFGGGTDTAMPAEAGDEAARPAFGQRSPDEKAQRLARVLVSDMITYNPELYERAVARGTVEEDFENEIRKSWEEYVDQVGPDLANSTSYWDDALNDILRGGDDTR